MASVHMSFLRIYITCVKPFVKAKQKVVQGESRSLKGCEEKTIQGRVWKKNDCLGTCKISRVLV